jgi:hypothetical protein
LGGGRVFAAAVIHRQLHDWFGSHVDQYGHSVGVEPLGNEWSSGPPLRLLCSLPSQDSSVWDQESDYESIKPPRRAGSVDCPIRPNPPTPTPSRACLNNACAALARAATLPHFAPGGVEVDILRDQHRPEDDARFGIYVDDRPFLSFSCQLDCGS